ncbi:MAG: SLC13/DASS family transporter [Candidatus Hydrogenedentes bacterium]|nr:SLC13/DASS family transporter [Candidatus Hydrogenedentota bacterium]
MRDQEEANGPFRVFMLIAAPAAAAALVAFGDLSPGHPEVTRTAAVALWMALWWLSTAVPLAATAMLPVVLFPALGVMSGKDVPGYYFNDIIFLFLGGFLVALAMQRWDLHRRIALRILLFFGGRPSRVLLGFMAPTFFLSMWISNTATTMMMAPIAISLIVRLEESGPERAVRRFSTALLLGIAYSASVGGTATLIGTPPNLSMVVITERIFPGAPPMAFAPWFAFALPGALLMLAALWAVLRSMYLRDSASLRVDMAVIREQYRALGPVTFEQRAVFAVFAAMALLWLTREGIQTESLAIPGWSALFPEPSYLRDGTVATALALILFVLPAPSRPGARIMDWQTARALPWDIVLLFGGGFALAAGFSTSGLAAWAGEQMTGLAGFPPVALVFFLCLAVSFLTELTSNAATTEMLLPVIAALAVAIQVHPFLLIIPVTLACSFAFMLPVATPPNALIFGTNRVKMLDMARTGFVFNLLAVALVTIGIFTLGSTIFAIDLDAMPAWATLSPAAE